MSRWIPGTTNWYDRVGGARNLKLPWDVSGYSILFLTIAFLKSPEIFMHPRFWAEEGTIFYTNFLHLSVLKSIIFIKSGSLQILTNATVYLSTKVPVALAPAVTTYSALALHLVVVFQLALFARAHGLAKTVAILLVTTWALLPQTYEVWLSATNAQWITGVSVLMFLSMPSHWIGRHWKGGAAWCLVCGLSGVPSTLPAPVFFIRSLIERSFPIAVLASVLSADAVVQLAILVRIGESRPYLLDPSVLFVPLFLQSVLSPVLSADIVDRIGYSILNSNSKVAVISVMGTVIGGLGIMGFATVAAYAGSRKYYVWLILVAWLIVTIIENFGSLDPQHQFSGWLGGRYFLLGSFCLCLLLAWGTMAEQAFFRFVSAGLLSAIVVSGVYTAAFSSWTEVMRHGPSWRKQIEMCRPRYTCEIRVWPGSWVLELRK
jgi:hypothetical protein